MGRNTHDETARRIARRRGGEYNKGQGPDIQLPGMVVEVESDRTVSDAGRQLSGFTRPVYVAGANANATKKALERYKDSTIGVMDQNGNILKRSTRKRN